MARFRYTSSDANGERLPGFVEADDEKAAREQLDSLGIIPESLERVLADAVSPEREDSAPAPPPVSIPGSTQASPGRIGMTADEHVEVIGQIGNLISAGVPLSAGLRTLSEEVPSRRLRAVFDRLSERLSRGESLEDAMKSESGDLPQWLAAVFSAGTRSGRLPECIHHFISFSRLRSGMRATLIISMIYPALLLTIGLIVCGALCVYLIPQFRDIFYDFGVQLPVLTETLISISRLVEFLVDHWPLVLLGFWAAVLSAWLISKSVVGAAGMRRLLYHAPLLGRIFKLSALAEFSQLLALLIEAQMPLHEALRLVGGAVRDPNLSEAAYRAAEHLEEGASFASLRGVVYEVPDELLRIPGWGKNDATLVESLRVSSEVFALQSEISGRGFVGFITPVSVIFAGGMIMLTVLGLFLPLIKLLNDLS